MKKNEEQDFSKEISNLKIYMAIMAIVIVVLGIYVVAGAVGFSGMKGNVGGKAYVTGTSGTSGVIYVNDANGRVGIGTTGPQSNLQVSGSNPQLRVSDSAVSGKSVALITGTGWSALASTGDLSINTGSNLGSTPSGEAIRVTSGGNVGIGTTNPQNQLSIVDNSITGNGINISDTAGDYTWIKPFILEIAGKSGQTSITSGIVQTSYVNLQPATALCVDGRIYYDGHHFYGCVSTVPKQLDS